MRAGEREGEDERFGWLLAGCSLHMLSRGGRQLQKIVDSHSLNVRIENQLLPRTNN